MSVGAFVTDGPLLLAAPVAAAAGLLSFLSPCVLPLVPGYLSFVTGLTGEDLESGARPAGAGSVGGEAPVVRSAAPTPAVAVSAGTRSAGARPHAGSARQPVGDAVGTVPAAASAITGTVSVGAGSADAGSADAGSADAGSVGSGATVVRPPVPTAAVAASAAASAAARIVARAFRRGRVVAGTGLFVLGFTAVFVSYGAAFGGRLGVGDRCLGGEE